MCVWELVTALVEVKWERGVDCGGGCFAKCGAVRACHVASTWDFFELRCKVAGGLGGSAFWTPFSSP